MSSKRWKVLHLFPLEGSLGQVLPHLDSQITRDRKTRMDIFSFDQGRSAQTANEHFDIRKTSIKPASPGTAPLSKADRPQIDAEISEMRSTPYGEVMGH